MTQHDPSVTLTLIYRMFATLLSFMRRALDPTRRRRPDDPVSGPSGIFKRRQPRRGRDGPNRHPQNAGIRAGYRDDEFVRLAEEMVYRETIAGP